MGETHVVTLHDGSKVSYADRGDLAGPVLLDCHGTPESRLPDRATSRLAGGLGFRLVLPDRPGFGQSDPKPGRPLLDRPDPGAPR